MGFAYRYTVMSFLYPVSVLSNVRVSFSHIWHLVQFFSKTLPSFETDMRLLHRTLLFHILLGSSLRNQNFVGCNSVTEKAAKLLRGASRGQIAELHLNKGIWIAVFGLHLIRLFGFTMHLCWQSTIWEGQSTRLPLWRLQKDIANREAIAWSKLASIRW